ncbi:glycosyltransferase [Qipengyuania marisflavi]|uniref:Glycosyltransferase family 4 protein n=1 Tax=Qipengyuania marisflavi TaxID=2486356 RepID=A0A5S3P710_9SPHN|nr:glycosyltransferase [Qipengyuania marisflavi]TMM49021.1 glycosyltransferase family 4 protein [Qipengyuania marisflavi]
MTPDKTRRVLTLSTLWPNAANPRFGTFVAQSVEALQAGSHWQPTVINPIGLPPLTVGPYKALSAAAVDGKERGIEIYRPTFRLLPKFGGRFNPGQIVRAALPLARRLHAQQPFDLVDAQFFYPDGPAAMRIAQELGLPFSAKARGADIHYWGARSYGRKALLETADKAAGVLAVCEALADDMTALGMERGKITVHYTGLDRDRFRPLGHTMLRQRIAGELGVPIGENDELVVTVGALIARKGQELVIRALAGLPAAQLLLVGQGEDDASLRKLSKDSGVADRVHFLGSVDHDLLPPILSAADVMVLPSTSEGLANAWIEALACGTPIVITDAGGAREVVTGPEAGVIVARTVRALREGIRLVIDRKYSPQVVAASVDGFSWEANGAALADYYDRLLAT